jgi:hypothetical protein
MRANYKISLIPGIMNIGGIYLLNFGLVTSMSVFYAATLFGIANIVSPLIKHQKHQASLPQNSKISQNDTAYQ